MKKSTCEIFNNLFASYEELTPLKNAITEAVEQMMIAFSQGGKVLVCGNGGSAADSEHIVGELMKGFLLPRHLPTEIKAKLISAFPEDSEVIVSSLQQAVPAISLVSQSALMTAFGNDVSSQMVFAQQVLGYGKPGDVLIAISTSGNSQNVLYAAMLARVQEMKVISLTGESGGKLKNYSDICICAPFSETFKIQEYHLPIYHCICACVENELFGEE